MAGDSNVSDEKQVRSGMDGWTHSHMHGSMHACMHACMGSAGSQPVQGEEPVEWEMLSGISHSGDTLDTAEC